MLWLRTALFTLLVPGTVFILVPAALLATGLGPRFNLGAARWIGVLPLGLGSTIILVCFVEFIVRGRGTPAPYDPPRELVVTGPYRYVRNPQYLGVMLVVLGEALLAEAAILLTYAALLAFGYDCFVRHYEEPTLGRLYGEAYTRYCTKVPRWLPTW